MQHLTGAYENIPGDIAFHKNLRNSILMWVFIVNNFCLNIFGKMSMLP